MVRDFFAIGSLVVFVAMVGLVGLCAVPASAAKTTGVFYPPKLLEKALANTEKLPWAAEVKKSAVDAARPWLALSDDDLWNLMFGCTITRSWMVWSDGYCPACKKGVPMYNWKMDALGTPWKVRCPHCNVLFPKNDFGKFYHSGLDEHGVFDPARADRSLLYNTEHPDPKDPLHLFGVDDGNGYVDGGKRWRFIGAYLIYGQWKQAIVSGIARLGQAYLFTGDRAYAHRAGILLDRVADLYPTFDFGKQAILYEIPGNRGYVSTWHDACGEVQMMVEGYDQVFDGIKNDPELVTFLSRKAREYGLENPKSSFADIQRNIEDRIFTDTKNHRDKIESNYPTTDIALTMIDTVLGWPENREQVLSQISKMIERVSAVDGMTGEKGLDGYAAIGPRSTAVFLGRYARIDDGFLKEMLRRCPQLYQTYRFHLDTWCLQGEKADTGYYPQIGDAGSFARKNPYYAGVSLVKNPGLGPSMFSLLWQLYECTGDVGFVQALYHGNGNSLEGLPYDLLVDDPHPFQEAVGKVIAREGPVVRLGSVDKKNWHLALLRSGSDTKGRVLLLDYDARGPHGHMDGLNLGLLAKGMDLMPDFGYPPVQFGGWDSVRSNWYLSPAAHNTVMVDGQPQNGGHGETTLWADGNEFRAVRASAAGLIGGQQFERTALLVDISPEDSYALDVFRVVGGKDHAKFTHGALGTITTSGLSLRPGEEYGYNTQLRNFQTDPSPKPGWMVDWKVEDRYKYREPGADIHLRALDLTSEAQVSTAEAWIAIDGVSSNAEDWIPCTMVRRRAENAPLESTFVSVLEPYERASRILNARRLPLETLGGKRYPESNIAVEVALAGGDRDIIVAADVGNPREHQPSVREHRVLVQKETGLCVDGELCQVRLDTTGRVRHLALCRGRSVGVGSVVLKLKEPVDFLEIAFEGDSARVVSGKPESIEELRVGGKRIY